MNQHQASWSKAELTGFVIAMVLTLSACAERPSGVDVSPDDRALISAIETGATRVQVEGEGEVTKILPDDHEGDRHQRFILRLRTGQTLLVSHNIDLAPRISSLREGDRVAFKGEYEWNPRGGVVHWTHHDPSARRSGGWLRHIGEKYE